MIRRSRSPLPLVALAWLTPVTAHAATTMEAPSDAEKTEDEGQVVITAARTVLPPNALPLTIDVIDKEALDQQIAISGSVTDAVATLTPSFSPTRQKLSGSGETLRGRSPLYAINGIPQSTPMRDSSRDGFTIDGFFVDRVELIYGSNALQGIGGTGGIVNQVTVGAPKTEGLSGRVLLQGTADGDFRSDGIGYKAAGLIQYKAGRFDATVGATYEKRGAFYDAKGRRIGLNLTQGETQDSRATSLFARFGYELSSSARLDLIASRFELDGDGDYVATPGNRTLGIPTTSIKGTPPGVPAANRVESVALSLTDRDLWGGNFVSQIFFNRSHDTFGGEVAPIATFQDPAIAPIGTLFDQSENRSRKIGGKLSYERGLPGFDDLTLTLGFDALWDRTEQRLIATDRIWVPPSDFQSLAPFAQANLKLFDGVLRLAGGARWENVKITIDDYRTLASTTATGTPPNPATFGGVAVGGGTPKFDDVLVNGGVIFEPVAGIRAYASYAEGFTVPDIGRITRAVNRTGIDMDSYVDISPVISNNREIGIEVKRGPLDASATYFWSSSDKGQLLITRPDRIFDVQRLRVEIQGLEVALGIQTPIDGLRLGIGYAHLIGRYDADATPDGVVDTDLDGVNISPDRLNLSASYASGPFSARVQSQFYLSRSFHADTGKTQPDQRNNFGGYNVTDANVRYDTGIGALSLSVQNLLNTQYIDYSSDTRLPTDNLAFFAGRGRTFTLGWDYRF
ncbi:TonB-dependent receptor [Sphingomonas koreensis]|uniref:TonB-dependent receptor n=1 Tax=Sphingomonas koreensis TaxID=93064 RepID=UPI00082B6C3C|nr:iron complex outermembrane receptor protein [Sphingomonas koreensis]RSU62925.1 TonB-dependent receptor [Sphingomonas koreensis]RSU71635.1 TonB-dependent receptor [Sphingomonas koreensis]